MNLDALGFEVLSSAPSSSVERGAVIGSLAAASGFAVATAVGARPLAALVAGSAVGLAASSVGSSSKPVGNKTGEIHWSNIKVSLNLTEAVVVPIAGGLVLSLSEDTARRRDGFGLLTVGAVGAAVAYLAIRGAEAHVP